MPVIFYAENILLISKYFNSKCQVVIDHFWYGAIIGSLWSSPYQNRLAGHRSSTESDHGLAQNVDIYR